VKVCDHRFLFHTVDGSRDCLHYINQLHIMRILSHFKL